MKKQKVKIAFTTDMSEEVYAKIYGKEILCSSFDMVETALEYESDFLFFGQVLGGTICTERKEVDICRFCVTENGYFLEKVRDLEDAFGIEENLIKQEEDFNAIFDSDDDDEIENALENF